MEVAGYIRFLSAERGKNRGDGASLGEPGEAREGFVVGLVKLPIAQIHILKQLLLFFLCKFVVDKFCQGPENQNHGLAPHLCYATANHFCVLVCFFACPNEWEVNLVGAKFEDPDNRPKQIYVLGFLWIQVTDHCFELRIGARR